MFFIVAHHFVVNSTVWNLFDPLHPTANSLFLQLWGMWGKTAINAFVMITGYFMCEKRFTAKRYCKMLLEILFYSWVMWLVMATFGYEAVTLKSAVKRLVHYGFWRGQNAGFVHAFMWMYLTIPFMNVYLKAATKRNLYSFLAVLLCLFSVCGTVFNANVYHHVFWYMTLYLVGATVRLYPLGWMGKNRICVPALALAVIAAMGSVAGIVFASKWIGRPIRHPYFFVSDSHKALAFAVAFLSFLVFRNLRIPQSRFINAVASTTFGVLLIHAANNGMRKWLWRDFVDVPGAYFLPLPSLAAYAIVSAAGVFAVCSALDWLRIRFVERPFFRFMNRREWI